MTSPTDQQIEKNLVDNLVRHPDGILASQIRSCLRGDYESWGFDLSEQWVSAFNGLISAARECVELRKAISNP